MRLKANAYFFSHRRLIECYGPRVDKQIVDVVIYVVGWQVCWCAVKLGAQVHH